MGSSHDQAEEVEHNKATGFEETCTPLGSKKLVSQVPHFAVYKRLLCIRDPCV